MNYLKSRANRLKERLDPDRPSPGDLDEIDRLLSEALAVKNRIVEMNLRLVVSIAKTRVGSGYGLSECVSDGNLALIQAVDRFDFARGNKFSTYATRAIRNQLGRKQTEIHPSPRPVLDPLRGVPHGAGSRLDEPDAEEGRDRTGVGGPALARSARRARAVGPRKPLRARRRPPADAHADRPAVGDQQGARPPDRGPRSGPSSGSGPASKGSSRWRSDARLADHERPHALERVSHRSRRATARRACCCTSRRCPRVTASATSGRPRWHGSTGSARRGRPGGRRCRWAPPGMATRRINPCRLSPAMAS